MHLTRIGTAILILGMTIIDLDVANANPVDRHITPAQSTPSQIIGQIEPPTKWEKLSVGVNIGKVNVLDGISVRGKIDGSRAIDLPHWQLAYQDIVEALKLKIKPLPDGQLEVRTPTVVTRIDPKQLQVDADLGVVLSIDDLSRLFGIKADFDLVEYAIIFTVPWQGQKLDPNHQQSVSSPINVDGLPRIHHPQFAISRIQQSTISVGGANSPTSSKGDLAVIGSLWGYSSYVQIDQSKLLTPQTWNLRQIQLAKTTDAQDWLIGSQSPFWRSQGSGDYVGFTSVSRHGFQATPAAATGGINPQQRLQAAEFGNTVIGEAPSGTLVRLTQGFSNSNIVAEVLVDASNKYRFENVTGHNYRLLLYPRGQLNVLPEVRDVAFSQIFGQIPVGTAATLWSGGIGRKTGTANFWGDVTDVRGGVAHRWGVSPDLTVGLGAIYDRQVQGLGEVFWRPPQVPVRVALSGLVGSSLDLNSTIDYQPTSNLNVNLVVDRLSTRLRTNWQLSHGLSLTGSYDPSDVGSLGAQFSNISHDGYTYATASFDTAQRLRWYLQQRWGVVQLSYQGTEQKITAAASYDLSPHVSTNGGSSIVASHESNNLQTTPTQLSTLTWRYQSPVRTSDGTSLWETELGYGVSSFNQGIIASVSTPIVPGLALQGSYEGATQTDRGSAFRLELVSSLNLSHGIQLGDRQIDALRTHGNIILQPFFDRNANGSRDPGEESYLEELELLASIDSLSIQSFNPVPAADGISIRTNPGTHRLDFDPAGFPPNWQTDRDAVAVEVAAGADTRVDIPLVLAFNRSGVVTTTRGKPMEGARIEAIGIDRDVRVFSISSVQGLFTLQGLRLGKYRLEVNGKQVGSIEILPSSPSQATLNLKF